MKRASRSDDRQSVMCFSVSTGGFSGSENAVVPGVVPNKFYPCSLLLQQSTDPFEILSDMRMSCAFLSNGQIYQSSRSPPLRGRIFDADLESTHATCIFE